MPASSHNTKQPDVTHMDQLLDVLWTSEVVPTLPETIESKARELHAFQRVRGISCATDLLRALLAYVFCGYSFRMLGIWATIQEIANISDTAWRNRLRHSSAWLLWLIQALTTISTTVGALAVLGIKRVLLIDATTLRVPGGTGDDWRIHTAYDLIAGCLAQVVATERTTAESLAHFDLKPGDLVVADAGYGWRRHVAEAITKGFLVILRIHPSTFPVTTPDGQNLDLIAMIRRNRTVMVQDIPVLVEHDGRTYPARVVIGRLPWAQALAARKRKIQKTKKKTGKRPTQDQLVLAGVVLLVTTTDARIWSASMVLRLYRARWQIELVFKRMKQIMRLATIRCRTTTSVEATIRAFLVAWLLHDHEAVVVRQAMSQAQMLMTQSMTEAMRFEETHVLSQWLMTTVCLETVRNQVRGIWSRQRLRACMPKLYRYFYRKKRPRREHQETTVRAWLMGCEAQL